MDDTGAATDSGGGVDTGTPADTGSGDTGSGDTGGGDTGDITGGAAELNPHFSWLVEQCVARGKHVIVHSNLTVLLLPKLAHLPAWLAERGVEIVCSLPHYRRLNTDAQREAGTFDRSIEAIKRLNALGYGQGDPARVLTVMHNPAGAFLPGSQASLTREWKDVLARQHGVQIDRLIVLNNLPIGRFLDWLDGRGMTEAYLQSLTAAFNLGAVDDVMCRNTISIGWDGRVYDCDFNQMLELPVKGEVHVGQLVVGDLEDIVTALHCFGCTAGAGSSCGGATT